MGTGIAVLDSDSLIDLQIAWKTSRILGLKMSARKGVGGGRVDYGVTPVPCTLFCPDLGVG